MYLLDTNHCSRVIQGEPSVITRLEQAGDIFVGTCVIVSGELRFMVQKSKEKEKNLYTINEFLKNIKIYPIDNKVAEIYGDFKFSLYEHFGPKERKRRTQTEIHKLGFSENDLWIAAIARRNDLIIVSSDSDFSRMKEVLDISIESWYNPV
jgi:tRNA(fMet)-specific endonuclease VapC